MGASTTVERKSDRELVVTRTVDGPARLVFQAWADPALFRQWWVPASFGLTLVSYEADVRTGGGYRLVMSHPAAEQRDRRADDRLQCVEAHRGHGRLRRVRHDRQDLSHPGPMCGGK